MSTADEFVHRSDGRDTYGDWGPPCFTAWTGGEAAWQAHLAGCAKCQRLMRTGKIKGSAAVERGLKPRGER